VEATHQRGRELALALLIVAALGSGVEPVEVAFGMTWGPPGMGFGSRQL